MRRDNNYTVVLHRYDGTSVKIEEWFTLKQSKHIASVCYDARMSVKGSDVSAIEIVDIDGNQIQIVTFDEEDN